jgi:hypothetical protein
MPFSTQQGTTMNTNRPVIFDYTKNPSAMMVAGLLQGIHARMR